MSSPTTAPTNPFLDFIPVKQAITVTGRRVIVVPFDQKTEAFILGADGIEDSINLGAKICGRHIHVGSVEDHRPLSNYGTEVLLSEETDMLYLARWYSYSKKSFDFRFKCPACNTADDLQVLLKGMRRELFECGDDACCCRTINARARRIPDSEWDSIKWMDDEWYEVPEDHLKTSPPALTFNPVGDLKVMLRFLMVGQKMRVAKAEMQFPDTALQVHLEEKVVGVSWPSKMVNATSRKDLTILLAQMPLDLRLKIKDWHDHQLGGVDQAVGLKCSSRMCGRIAEETVQFSSDFFLPRKFET